MERSAAAASEACKSNIGKNSVELVIVQIILIESAGEVLGNNPETVIQRQTLADGDDVERTIGAQTALGEESMCISSIAGNDTMR